MGDAELPMTAHCTRLRPARANDPRIVLWLDIDNCLYSKRSGISEQMQDLCVVESAIHMTIHAYFVSLGMPDEEASRLHTSYYKSYGLSIRGLIRHHHIDPLDFDRKCDGALPLESIIAPDPALRELLLSIDTDRVRICALTNAYRIHAQRVLKILELDDLIELIVSCDYANPSFRCKPEAEYFAEAMHHSGVVDKDRHFFVDDSALNIAGALAFGWQHAVLYDEEDTEHAKQPSIPQSAVVRSLHDLRAVWGEAIFRPSSSSSSRDA